MFRKNLFFTLIFSFFILGACSQEFPEEEGSQLQVDVPAEINIEITEVADNLLKLAAEGLSPRYTQRPKNQVVSSYQSLSDQELQDSTDADVDLNGLVENSARKIGEDLYYVKKQKVDTNLEKFSVYKNNESVYEFSSEPLTSYSPLISVRVIENKYTVEYIEKMYSRSLKTFLEKQRIWQDGVGEITQHYGLQNAIVPYEANGKMVFLAQKNDKWHVMYDGKQISEEFERIDFGYCCEPAKYMPKAFNYRYYVFFATQDSKQKLVEVDLGGT